MSHFPSKKRIHDNVEQLVGRDKEFNYILDSMTQALTNETPLSLYLYGKPGTGKTLTIENSIRDIMSRKQLRLHVDNYVTINAMTVKTPTRFFIELSREVLGHGTKDHIQQDRLIKTKIVPTQTIIFIDEIETFNLKAQQELLYKIFELPFLPHSKIILISISNSGNLTNSLLPGLR